MVNAAFPGHHAVDVEPLTDGFRNANFKVRIDAQPECVVLRIYEHDASLCGKEIDLLRLIENSVPVPEIIHAEPEAEPPFAFFRYVDGITFRELKRHGDAESVHQAASDAGRILASIGRVTFPSAGWLGPGPRVTAPLLEGNDPIPRFVDLCLASANARERLPERLRDQASALVWSYAPRLASLEIEACLVHCDFGGRNLLVRNVRGVWSVAAVLDWEFAMSGPPLIDIGHFLRYEVSSRPKREPHFSNGYLQAGGRLPRDWRSLAGVLDLSALCDNLTHAALPPDVIAELMELVTATVEGRDPDFS